VPGPLGDRRLTVVAHSLGGLLTHSAILYSPPNTVDAIAMSEAAFAAEVFDRSTDEQLIPNAQSHGWAADIEQTDMKWRLEYRDLSEEQLQSWIAVRALQDSLLAIPPHYGVRWSQQRPSSWVPSMEPVGQCPAASWVPSLMLGSLCADRGPWAGLFAGNMLLVRKIVNSWNSGDRALDGWVTGQRLLRPVFPDGQDNPTTQRWGKIPPYLSASDDLALLRSPASANALRQWGELAFWFPALSLATGAKEVQVPAPAWQNLNFTSYADNSGIDTSHSFLIARPYHAVWKAFDELRRGIEP